MIEDKEYKIEIIDKYLSGVIIFSIPKSFLDQAFLDDYFEEKRLFFDINKDNKICVFDWDNYWYYEYEKPKEKKKLYKYVYKMHGDWQESAFFYENDDHFKTKSEVQNFFDDFKRLDYTMIEVYEDN